MGLKIHADSKPPKIGMENIIMGMIKKGTTAAPVAEAPKETTKAATPATVDSGTAAAVSRLQKKTTEKPQAQTTDTKYAGRDFAAEARGKTRCVQFEAALMSPGIAGMKWETTEDYLALCAKAADYGVAYTFDEPRPKYDEKK